MIHSLASAFFLLLPLLGSQAFLLPSPVSQRLPLPHHAARRATTPKMMLSPLDGLETMNQVLIAYADDTKPTLNAEIIGVSFIGAFAGLTAVFALLTKNLKGKSFSFQLTEEEQAAVDGVRGIFDNEADLELTEAGTVGFVKRKKLAEKAKEAYQKGKDERDVRDKTLYYAEVDLDFLATLLRAAQPAGGVFYDLGSGVGRACFAAGKLYKFKKVIGIEYLDGLHKEAGKYDAKYKRLGNTSPTQFLNKDFTSVSYDDADVVFLYATKYSPAEVEAALSTVPVGARIISLDRTLKGRGYKLLKTVEDPAGDLQRVNGYVYEKIA